MLVLSRRQDDKIVFPNLGVSVHILRIGSGKVRVGIDAPPTIKVLREELLGSPRQRAADDNPTASGDLRPLLQSAASALNKLHRLNSDAANPQAESLIFEVFHQLKSIDEQSCGAPRGSSDLDGPTKRTALLVEDNPNEQRLLASYLRLRDFEVAVADDGAAALDYLSRHDDPDVVLLDMQMPGMDGATAINRLRSQNRYRDLKVYAVSGGDPADYGVDVSPEGVNGWFPKPLDPEAVLFRLAFDEQPGAPRLSLGPSPSLCGS